MELTSKFNIIEKYYMILSNLLVIAKMPDFMLKPYTNVNNQIEKCLRPVLPIVYESITDEKRMCASNRLHNRERSWQCIAMEQ